MPQSCFDDGHVPRYLKTDTCLYCRRWLLSVMTRGQDTLALQRARRCRPYHLATLLEALLIGRLVKSEDLLSEVLVR